MGLQRLSNFEAVVIRLAPTKDLRVMTSSASSYAIEIYKQTASDLSRKTGHPICHYDVAVIE